MPGKETLERAEQDKREGKSPSTQAGEFVREEIHHIREGKHGAASAKQAIAIGLSKARRAGVDLATPKKGSVSAKTRKSAERDSSRGRSRKKKAVSVSRSRSSEAALNASLAPRRHTRRFHARQERGQDTEESRSKDHAIAPQGSIASARMPHERRTTHVLPMSVVKLHTDE